jgi:glycine/D-amino acid oxidase-like deaminating enzyme
MAPRVEPVRSDEALPARADVVIIGGGIIGTSTALFLAQKGVSTVLCEKGHVAGEQSSRNWGWCRKMGRDPREIPLIVESLRLWQGMNALVEADTGFRQPGIMYLSETQAQLDKLETWLEYARQYQLDTRIITGVEVAELLPGSVKDWAGALYTPSDGKAEPQQAAPAIAEAARRLGAGILTQCAVRGIDTAGGRVVAAVTEKGRIVCDSVVLAGGAWSRLFCGNLGLDLPQLKILSSVMRTERVEGGPECSASGAGFGYRKRLDGGYNVSQLAGNVYDIVPDSLRLGRDFLPLARNKWSGIRFRVGQRLIEEWRIPRRWRLDQTSPFEKVRVLDPEPAQKPLDQAHASLAAVFPIFRGVAIAERWAGLIDVTPDAVPVISSVESLPGFFVATGFSGHGFGIGPGAGKLMADLVTGDPTLVDPLPFRLGRFTDGSYPLPYPLATAV